MSTIKVKINGKEVEIQEKSTVQSMLDQRNVTGTMFVVEKNLEIIQKNQYQKILVQENDHFEIVGFFGGG